MELLLIVLGFLQLMAFISVVVNVNSLSHNVATIAQMLIDDREEATPPPG